MLTVKLRSIATGGEAVGEVEAVSSSEHEHLLGITTFVPYGAPGEKVLVSLEEEKGNFIRGNLVEVLDPSHSRTDPECAYYGSCGGCQLQHINYISSLDAKYQMLIGAMRAGKLPSNVIDSVLPIEQSLAYGYRRRINLHIDSSGTIGFYRPNSRSLVVVDSCSIASKQISDFIPKIQALGHEIKGKFNSVSIEEDTEGVIAVFNAPYELSDKELSTIHSTLSKNLNRYLVVSGTKVYQGTGSPFLELRVSPTMKIRIPGGAFSQVNWEINQKLINFVLSCLEVNDSKPVYDLYAGAGNFTIPIAKSGRHVISVECDTRLASYGRENASKLGLSSKVSYHDESVESFLKKNKGNLRSGDVILDPPRSGVGPLVKSLKFAKKIVLISCHLPSFVRDLRGLIEQGFTVKKIKPFDMFPQTAYLEITALLELE